MGEYLTPEGIQAIWDEIAAMTPEQKRALYEAKKHIPVKRLAVSIDEADTAIGHAVDELSNVMDWLRAEKQFDKSDILRRIIGDLARLIVTSPGNDLLRDEAKGWK